MGADGRQKRPRDRAKVDEMTKRTNGKEPSTVAAVSREDSLSKWAANALPHLGSSLDPALDYKLEDLATQQKSGFASVRVREVTEGLRKQCSKIDAGLFDGLPKEAGNQTMGDVWAGIVASGGGATGAGASAGEGHGRLAIGGTSGKANAASAAAMGSLMSLPSMSTWTAMQFVTAMASVGEGANAQAAQAETTTKSTTRMSKKKTDENDAPSGRPSRVLVPVVPGVSYEPKKLKRRSNIPTPTVREALAPRKMGRRPKNAPKETDEEKQQRLAERLFRNRESAARSRERRQNAMQVLQDENDALRKEVAALKAQLAKLKK